MIHHHHFILGFLIATDVGRPSEKFLSLFLYLKDGRERKTGLGSTDLRKQNNHIFHHTLV